MLRKDDHRDQSECCGDKSHPASQNKQHAHWDLIDQRDHVYLV